MDEDTLEVQAPPAPTHCEPVPEGGTCAYCGWNWDSTYPHSVYLGKPKPEEIPLVAPAMVKAPKAPSPTACPAVGLLATCPVCGWNGADEANSLVPAPHPVTS